MTTVWTSPSGLRAELDAERCAGQRIGLVPTMGALHEGHTSLLDRARAENDSVVCSIYVNPLQFGDAGDLARYPRDLATDLGVLERLGVEHCFAPDDAAMYPSPAAVTVEAGPLGEVLEGRFRPGHFRGVATVVTKLCSIVGPARAYFGEKDYQQLVLVRRLVADLSLPVEVVACPTVRAPDGLALSSRNALLDRPARRASRCLAAALERGHARVRAGAAKPAEVEDEMAAVIDAEPGARRDYAVVRDPERLEPVAELAGDLRLLVAATIGPVRLIDNLGVRA